MTEEFNGFPSIDDYLNQEGCGYPVSVSELSEFIDLITANSTLDKSQAKRVLTLFFHNIRCMMLQGEQVRIDGFGTFSIKTNNGKKKCVKIKIKPFKQLLDKING